MVATARPAARVSGERQALVQSDGRSVRALPVTVQTSGCAYVSNGALTRTAAFEPGPELLRRLEPLTK